MDTYEDTDARSLDLYNASRVVAHKAAKFTVDRTADYTEYFGTDGNRVGFVRENTASWPLDKQGWWVRNIYTNVGNSTTLHQTREEAEAAAVKFLSI